nr:(Fe-S)-binding protein [Pyrobaculum islandicum]
MKGIITEASKCQFCGFCEFACPTYRVFRMRHFGPRGRINIVKNFDGKISEEAYRGVMTCLACGACEIQCPAEIKITEVIHTFKTFLISQRLSEGRV